LTLPAVVFRFAGGFTSAVADEHGYFEIKRIASGSLPGWPPASPHRKEVQNGNPGCYYPGVPTRDLAVIVELDQAEKRVEISFAAGFKGR